MLNIKVAKKNSLRWLLCFFHGMLLMIITFLWTNSIYTYENEVLLVKWSNIIKHVFIKDRDLEGNDFLFIDLSYEKSLIPHEDGIGNEVITNRAKLAEFFNIIKSNPHIVKFILCDVLLKGKSEDDSLLKKSIGNLTNVIFPLIISDSGKVEKPIFNVPGGIVEYETVNESVYSKFSLFQNDSVKTLPLAMYEAIEKKQFKSFWGFHTEGPYLCLNSIVTDYPVRPYQIFTAHKYPVINLSELLSLPPRVINEQFLKNRIVCMGDFTNDTHETVLNKMPGTLILLNNYLSLKLGYHHIHLLWAFLLLITYSVLSYNVFYSGSKSEAKNTFVSLFFDSLFKYVLILIVISLASYLFFHIQINILVIGVYLNILHSVVHYKNQIEKMWIKDVVLSVKKIFYKS
ncbi:MAG TPA: hypothetical protein VIM16_09790 [Mucilaginibacter sp.]|jgi:hypothetical protein